MTAKKSTAPKKKPAARKKAPAKPLVVEYTEIYKDAAGEWRWRAKAANHKIVSEGGEGYKNRMYARKVVRSLFPQARVVFL